MIRSITGTIRWAPWLLAVVWLAPGPRASEPPTAAAGAPYVPSPHSIVADLLELAEIRPDDLVVDLGSGDGRIVLTAAKVFGARGLGVEIRRDLVQQSRAAAVQQGVADRVRFVQQDLFDTDLSDATVVTIYLLPETVNRLRDKLLWELPPGARVLSHDYPIQNWQAEQVVELEHEAKLDVTGVTRTVLYLYRVPADVHGRWTVQVPGAVAGEPLAVEFAQRVTDVLGRARVDGRLTPLEDVSIRGRHLTFTIAERGITFTGQIDGSSMNGTLQGSGVRGRWRATRS